MSAKTVTITLRVEDVESWLRQNAGEAAKYGALCDYITRRTYNVRYRGYGESLDDSKQRWQRLFLKSKRIVESFGVEYEPTSEQETLGVHIPMKNEKRKTRVVAGMAFCEVSGGEPDYKNAMPEYRGEVHSQACHAAADRVVRKWRASLV